MEMWNFLNEKTTVTYSKQKSEMELCFKRNREKKVLKPLVFSAAHKKPVFVY